MDWLNFNHLFYFWMVAKEGGVAKAAAKLRRSQPTISAQLRLFEESLGDKLFVRSGRSMKITDLGRSIFRYANDIFSIGEELSRSIRERPLEHQRRLVVGLADAIPKSTAYRLLSAVFKPSRTLSLVCREDRPERLFSSLALNELDFVLSDRPAPSSTKYRLFSRLLREDATAFLAAPQYSHLRKSFPKSLASAAPAADSSRICAGLHLIEIGRAKDLVQRVYGVTSERSSHFGPVKELLVAGR